MMPLASRQANGLTAGSSEIMSTRDQCSKLLLDAAQGAPDNASPISGRRVMQYLGLAVGVGFLALVTALLALRVLLGGNWLLGWLRGTFGLLLLSLGGVVALVAWDVTTYHSLPQNKPLARLTFQAEGPQRYQARLEQDGQTRFVTLEGDLWQLDLRVLQWKGLAALIGLESGFRLQRLSGRYLAVEQQEQARNVRVELGESLLGLDFWAWLQRCQCGSLLVEAQQRRVSFLPIADGAEYAIEMTPTGPLAQPVNAAAERAMKDW